MKQCPTLVGVPTAPAQIDAEKVACMRAQRQTHLVLIPSYNSGPKLIETVNQARLFWGPVWIVIDGSTDCSAIPLQQLAKSDPEVQLFVLPKNVGKGAAILHGLRLAEAAGFTYVLTMDGDGQHPAALIPQFMAESIANPNALVLGQPIFDASAPKIRIHGRRLSNWWTRLETLWGADFDSLFGFRVYPIAALKGVMEKCYWMRRFDFDAEAAVRLYWEGFRPINLPAPVRYFTVNENGVSHFRYVRDNLYLVWMHFRLVFGCLRHLTRLVTREIKSCPR